MNLSFSRGQKLFIGGLVIIMVVCSIIASLSLRHSEHGMRHEVEAQAVNAGRFTQMASSFSQVGLDFYRQRAEDRFDLPGLLKSLDVVRRLAADLDQASLTQKERGHLNLLVTEEKRIRTALHLFATSGLADPSQESAAQVETELAPIISGAISQANDTSRDLSATLSKRHHELIQSMHDTVLVLIGGAVLTCLLGIVAYRHLIRTVDRPLSALLTAIYELMGGNFAYRLQASFSGAMGELADGIDAMAHLLETQSSPASPPKPEQSDADNRSNAHIQPVKSPRR